MNEKELAAELQASKDDESEWGEPEPTVESSPREKKRLAAMVSVRFAPDELEQVQRQAQARGLTVSAYLRSIAVARPVDLAWGNFVVTSTSCERYSAVVGSPRVLTDGRRLATSQG